MILYTVDHLLHKFQVPEALSLQVEGLTLRLPHKRSGRLIFVSESDFLKTLRYCKKSRKQNGVVRREPLMN